MDLRKTENRFTSKVNQTKHPTKFNYNYKNNKEDSPMTFRKAQLYQKQAEPVFSQQSIYSEQRQKLYNQNMQSEEQSPLYTQYNNRQFQQSYDSELLAFLQDIQMDQYADNFLQNRVKYSSLHLLQKDDLKEIGIPVGDRNIIMHHIQLLQDQSKIQPPYEKENYSEFGSYKEVGTRMRNTVQKFSVDQNVFPKESQRYANVIPPTSSYLRQNRKPPTGQLQHYEREVKENNLYDFLSEIGHQQFYGIFQSNCITYEDLKLLSRQDLVELNIPIGPRNAIMHHIKVKIQQEQSNQQSNQQSIQKPVQRMKAQSFQNDESPNVSFSSEEQHSQKFSPQINKKNHQMKSQVNKFLQGVDQINVSKQLNRSQGQQMPQRSSPYPEMIKSQNQQNIDLLIQQLVQKQDQMLKAMQQNVQIIDKIKNKTLSTMPSQPSLSELQSVQEDQNSNYRRPFNRKNETKEIPSYREVYDNIQNWKKIQ